MNYTDKTSDGTALTCQIIEGKTWDEITGLSHRHERVQFVNQHGDLLRHDVVSELTALVPRLVRVDSNKALPVAEIARRHGF